MINITDYEKVCDFNNLYEAHKKARLGKRHKPDVIAFEMDLAHNLWEIKDALERGTYKVVKRLRTQNKKKLKRRLKGLQKGYAEGRLDWEDIKRSMAATHGHLSHGHTYRLRAKLYNKTVFVRSTINETEDVTI